MMVHQFLARFECYNRQVGDPRVGDGADWACAMGRFFRAISRDLPRPALRAKIFRCSSDPNQRPFPRCPVDKRGGSRDVTNAGRDAVDAAGQARDVVAGRFSLSGRAKMTALQRTAKPCVRHRGCVKLAVANSTQPDRSAIKPAAMEAKGIRLQGERDISRQPIARECRSAPAVPVCSCAHLFTPLHARPRVQKAPGIPCSSRLRDKGSGKPRAQRAARTRDTYSAVIPGRAKREL